MTLRLWIIGSAALLTACGTAAAPNAPAHPPAQAAAQVDSQQILAREPATDHAEVLHVLIGWAELAPAYGGRLDERAKTRTKSQADTLATEILTRARKGEDFRGLMKTYSEDWASAKEGTSYTATPDAQLVPPFKALSLRLAPGETGRVETVFGWHVIQRIE